MKRGVWGDGQDTWLGNLRAVIRESGSQGFPCLEIEAKMVELGKPLMFVQSDIDALLELTMGDRLRGLEQLSMRNG